VRVRIEVAKWGVNNIMLGLMNQGVLIAFYRAHHVAGEECPPTGE
jgi:hypothetical protein